MRFLAWIGSRLNSLTRFRHKPWTVNDYHAITSSLLKNYAACLNPCASTTPPFPFPLSFPFLAQGRSDCSGVSEKEKKIEMEFEEQRSPQHGSTRAQYDCLLFDLDDTLYPFSSGISPHCAANIQEYMTKKLNIEEPKVSDICYALYRYYGTTMAGLKAVGYDFDYDDFHSFVHGRLPYELLKPDHVLRNLLLSLPIRKVVFTNSDKAHASKCLTRLGLEDCFDGIICFETLNPPKGRSDVSPRPHDDVVLGDSELSTQEIFDIMSYSPESGVVLPPTPVVCKPFEVAYEQAFKIAEIDPQRTLFFDDSVRNLLTATRLGLHTVLVGKSERPKGVDYALESIHNIKEAFPELLLEAEEEMEKVRYSRKIAIETSVQA